ncbi:pyridoxine/pyridoxamine 5'-phosphate oxidase [Cochliomyia hominivorax]
MNKIKNSIHFAKISTYPTCPVQMFQNIIERMGKQTLLINLATIDKEFGVLNRTVVYRGLSQDEPPHICFVTEKNSRKYQNLKENPKLSVTIVCPFENEFWQIRLFKAEAEEIDDETLKKYWQEEPLFAKIRSHLCECGKPNKEVELEEKYQNIMENCEWKSEELEQTETYTAFKIIPKIWDFYKSEPEKIADRVQYKRIEGETDKWEIYHVDA